MDGKMMTTTASASYRFRRTDLAKKAAEQKAIMAACNMHGRQVKSATIGGDPENSFEQAFATLAYTYIQDKAPRLLDYMLGFQLVERNDDNTKAVGIFGFKAGNQWVYAPVFFLNNDLKGHELMYLQGQDSFVPMKENWVNFVLNRKPHILGEPQPQSMQEMGVLSPDIRQMSMPPMDGKTASVTPGWVRRMLPNLADWATTSVTTKYAGLTERLSLPALMRRSLSLTKMAMQVCEEYPQIDKLCRQFYGKDFLKQALMELRDQALKASRVNVLEQPDTARQKQAAGPPVEIRVQDGVTITKNQDLSDSEREKLMRDGLLIRDHRNGEEVSKVYDVQVKSELVNPDGGGVYDVLVRPGKFEELLVIDNPHTAKGRKDFSTVIRVGDNKAFLNVHRTNLWARPDRLTREEHRKWLEGKGTESTDLKKGDTYVVVYEDRMGRIDGSAPFRVLEKYEDGRYKVSWRDYCDKERPTYLQSNVNRCDYDSNWGRDRELHGAANLIWFNTREGSDFKSMQGQLLVPPEAKVIKVESGPTSSILCCEDDSQSENSIIDPGSIADVQAEIMQKTSALKVWCDGREVSINSGPFSTKTAALIELVRSYGLGEKQARHVLRQAEVNTIKGNASVFRVKYAAGYPMMVGPGPSAPAIPEQQFGFDSGYGGVATTQPQEDVLAVQGMDPGMNDLSGYDVSPEAMPDQQSMQVAQQAGQMGQKEVFDTAMFSGLLRAGKSNLSTDKDMGDLLKALDRLGRILFQFYWHNEAFMDRYGKAEMPELEDTLRNAFEVLGDLILFLKEKDVDMVPGQDLISPTVQQSAG
jgi:hypothetical protein